MHAVNSDKLSDVDIFNHIVNLANEFLKRAEMLPSRPLMKEIVFAANQIAENRVGIDAYLSYDRANHYTRIRLDGIANAARDVKKQIYGTRIWSIPRPYVLAKLQIRQNLEESITENWDLFILEFANFAIDEYYGHDSQVLNAAYQFKTVFVKNSFSPQPTSQRQLSDLAKRCGDTIDWDKFYDN